MKAIVIYFSHSGNTRKAAEHVANALGLDTAQIMPDVSDPNRWAPIEFNPNDYSDFIINLDSHEYDDLFSKSYGEILGDDFKYIN